MSYSFATQLIFIQDPWDDIVSLPINSIWNLKYQTLNDSLYVSSFSQTWRLYGPSFSCNNLLLIVSGLYNKVASQLFPDSDLFSRKKDTLYFSTKPRTASTAPAHYYLWNMTITLSVSLLSKLLNPGSHTDLYGYMLRSFDIHRIAALHANFSGQPIHRILCWHLFLTRTIPDWKLRHVQVENVSPTTSVSHLRLWPWRNKTRSRISWWAPDLHSANIRESDL